MNLKNGWKVDDDVPFESSVSKEHLLGGGAKEDLFLPRAVRNRIWCEPK
jgi:hypothetical protein